MKSIHSTKIAIIIPIGDYPFLAQAVMKNIKEKSKNEVEIFFVTSSDYNRRLDRVIKNNHLLSPLKGKEHGIHLKLIDWAMKEIKHDWVCVQHADMFWLDNWEINLDNELIAITLPYSNYKGDFQFKEHKFKIGNKKITRTHDFCGFYNRNAICELGLTFQSGSINQLVSTDKLKSSRIEWIHRKKKLENDDELDGSDLIGLEIATNWPSRIKETSMKASYNHCWGMLEVANHIKRKGNVTYINKPFEKCRRGLPAFSFMSSMLFDKEEMSDKIIPWSIVKKHLPQNSINKVLMQYKETNNTGEDGIKKIIFPDKTLIQKVSMI